MRPPSGPRQQYSFATLFGAVGDLGTLNVNVVFDGLEEDEKRWQLREFCTGLILAVRHPSEHLRKLDTHLLELLPNALKHYPESGSEVSGTGNGGCIREAQDLLARLPLVPQRLFTLPFNNSGLKAGHGTVWDGIRNGQWAEKYLVPEARSKIRLSDEKDARSIMQLLEDMQDHAWENLFVTSFIDTNNSIFLMKIADLGHQQDLDFVRTFQRYVNVLAELIDEYDFLADAAKLGFQDPFQDPAPSVQALKTALFPQDLGDYEQSLSVLKTYLWSAWQRSVMLYFYYVIGVQLWEGASSTWSSFLAIRGVRRLIDLESEDYRGDGIPYLCNWAFELLRTTRTSLGLDFRRMISLFDNHFYRLEGRCVRGSTSTCKGDLPDSCQRFTGAEAKSQSMHAIGCDEKCKRIRWSEVSYRQCENPRAVGINPDHKLLSYRKASTNTMAISHVWSHGQGGRPEDGINVCLHKRYCRLAESFDCDSYWIDSTCIPEDKKLREEAIMSINDIFYNCRVTLISDKDLQSKNITDGSLEDFETLLSILLVCDWGVRAWTMLEAIRGSRSIQILCAGDRTVGLMDLLRKVHGEGAIDLAVLLGSAQHLLPSDGAGSARPVEEVGHLLSQRHASRKDDEIIVWGLLSNLKVPTDALRFWQAHEHVNTAFLMSSAPRVQGVLGSGWAPETPYIRPQRRKVQLTEKTIHTYSVRYPPYDGRGSYIASITAKGLRGSWLVHDLDHKTICRLCEACIEEMIPSHWTNLHVEGAPFIGEHDIEAKIYERPDYANACSILKNLASIPNAKVRVIRPLSREGTDAYLGNVNRGEDFAVLVAICVCIKPREITTDPLGLGDRDEWQWKGVYEWIDDVSPEWKVDDMLIA